MASRCFAEADVIINLALNLYIQHKDARVPSPFPDALPLGSHCSFERDACGWSVSTQPTSWRRLTGQQMMETRVDPQGDGLRRTPGMCGASGFSSREDSRGNTYLND